MISPDSAILIHDCGKQQLYIATAEGNTVQLVANWDEEFLPSTSFKTYYDQRTVVAAGIALADGTVRLRMIGNITLFDSNLSVSTDRDIELAIIPRTAYSVWDDDGTRHSSYDTSGMQPRAVLRDACPPTFRSMQQCYVVYMERASSMDFMRAYIPENGGIDMVRELLCLNVCHMADFGRIPQAGNLQLQFSAHGQRPWASPQAPIQQ